MSRSEHPDGSERVKTSAHDSGDETPAAFCAAGLSCLQAGRLIEAQVCGQRALEVEPHYVEAQYLMGLLALKADQNDHAVEWFVRAIGQTPKVEYVASLGTALQRAGRLEEASMAFDKAVRLKPNDADLWVKFGRVLAELGRSADALLTFQNALKLSPRLWDAAYESGVILYSSNRFEEAVKHFDLCCELRPSRGPTLQLRGLSQAGLKRFDEYLADSLAANALDPDNAETRNNIAGALMRLGRLNEALEWFDEALKVQPNLVETLNNKIALMGQLHRFDDAFALCDQMKTRGLNNARTEWVLAHLRLLTGDFGAGWTLNEVRLTLPSSGYPKFPLPRWLGDEAIDGKTILVCADEGLGDTVQFVRYVLMLIERGAQVVLVVQNPLHRLLSGLPGISMCLSFDGGQLPHIDMHCPICSLPLAFGTRLDTIPSAVPYLPPPAKSRVEAWEDRLGPHARLRVGLVWSGSLTHTNDHNRSIPLRTFSRILDVDATLSASRKIRDRTMRMSCGIEARSLT